MARIRSIKPGFYRDEELQDLEIAHPELKPMLVFGGLLGHADKNGNFPWNPRVLKLDILPFIKYDLGASLVLLREALFLSCYEGNDGKPYGAIRNFTKHQRISGKEAQEPAKFPDKKQGSTREAPEQQPVALGGERVIRKGEGGSGEALPPEPQHPLNHARRMMEILGMSQTASNLRVVEAGITAEANHTGTSLEDISQFIANRAIEDRKRGIAIDKFYFEDTKWRNVNGNKKPTSPVEARVSGNREVLSQALRDHIAQRVGPDSDKF